MNGEGCVQIKPVWKNKSWARVEEYGLLITHLDTSEAEKHPGTLFSAYGSPADPVEPFFKGTMKHSPHLRWGYS